MLRRYPLAVRIVSFVLVPLAVVAVWLWLTLRASLPTVQGRVELPGVVSRITVDRDARGVPHVVAANDRDAFFAIGYLHAQDRMWQLELQRRMALGRLSELFGKQSVQQDIWFRTLDLERSAHDAWSSLTPASQTSLQAYADGINAWIDQHHTLPAEFLILGIKPARWTVYDSLAWSKMFALDLGGNYRREMDRLLAAQVLDPQRLATLFPGHGVTKAPAVALHASALDAYERLAAFHAGLEKTANIGGRYVGSNAWAVSGKLTSDGSSLLANDPHLGLQMPSLWYMASLKGDRIDVAGATLVGLPLVIFGKNQSIAWGGTNLMADAQDIFFEQTKPDDASRYAVNGTWEAFTTREEIIQVREAFPAFLHSPIRPLRIRVRSSRHGPVISDMFEVFDQPAALRWTALDKDDTSYDAFYQLNYAHDWPSFQGALQRLVAPALNMLYADRDGHIGYIGAGRIPIRAAGDGSMPVPGWTDEFAWTGHIPFDALPRSYDPAEGFIASANNDPTGPDYPWTISRDFAPPWRAQRIGDLLRTSIAGKQPIDVRLMERMQADDHSEPAVRLLATLMRHEPTNGGQRRAYGLLEDWHGEMSRDSRGATVFNAWLRQLRLRLVGTAIDGYWNRSRANRFLQGAIDAVDPDTVGLMLSGRAGQWCRDAVTREAVDCDRIVDMSLRDGLREVYRMAGDRSLQSWTWGSVHETFYRHIPFSEVNLLKTFFERRIENGGSPDSVDVADFVPGDAGTYEQTFGPGFRQVMSLSRAATGHVYMNSTGQSGNVMSRHYDDMISDFRDVRYAPMTDASRHRLTLVPAAHVTGTAGGKP